MSSNNFEDSNGHTDEYIIGNSVSTKQQNNSLFLKPEAVQNTSDSKSEQSVDIRLPDTAPPQNHKLWETKLTTAGCTSKTQVPYQERLD